MANPSPRDDRDEFLGGISPLDALTPASTAVPCDAQLLLRAKLSTLRSTVSSVRRTLFPNPAREPALRELNGLLIRALTSSAEGLPEDLLAPVAQFQKHVPVVPATKVAALILPGSAPASVLRRMISSFDEGRIDEDSLSVFMDRVALATGVSAGRGALEARAQRLLAKLESRDAVGSKWVQIGAGSECQVFSAHNGMVYKFAPIHNAILGIPPIADDGPLCPRLDAYPLAGPRGSCPLLDRLYHMASLPGFALSDPVGITSDNQVIFKQAHLGTKEPSMDQLLRWAEGHGVAALSPQDADPAGHFGSDTNFMPTVSLCDGKPILMLDINPRNALIHDGRVVVFDPVSRALAPDEVRLNPEIASAVRSLESDIEISTP